MALRIKIFQHQGIALSKRTILSLSFFIRHYIDLPFQAGLSDRIDKKTHPVRLHPQHFFKGIPGNRFIIIGSIHSSTSIACSAQFLNFFEKSISAEMFRTLKQHMFKKMCKARLSWLFFCRSHMILNSHRYDRIRLILM